MENQLSITGVLELISKFGISTVFAVFFLLYFVKLGTKRDELIMSELAEIKTLVGKSVLTKEQTIGVFRSVLNTHIRRKILFAKQKLINNHIKNRKSQIEVALSSEFKKITQEEAQFLSTFSTPAGNVGYILMDILEPEQWDRFMLEVFNIFFGEGEIMQKLEDLSSYMGSIVNDMVLQIESKF